MKTEKSVGSDEVDTVSGCKEVVSTRVKGSSRACQRRQRLSIHPYAPPPLHLLHSSMNQSIQNRYIRAMGVARGKNKGP